MKILKALVKTISQRWHKTRKKINLFIHTSKAKARVAAYQEPLRVHGKSYLSRQTYLGKNTSFNGMEIRGWGKVMIGDNFHSGGKCLMITSNHNYEGDTLPYSPEYIHKDIVIGDNVWMGDAVIVLPGVTIGEGVIIQAGSVVVKDIPPLAIAGGHPAVPFKYRDKEHYERVKASGKFH